MRLLVSTLALIAMASCAPTGIFHEGIYKLRDDGLYDLGNCSRDFVSCIDGSCDLMRCTHGSVFDARSGQCQQISDLPDCIEIEVIVVEEASAEEVSGASGAEIVVTESGEELNVESGASGETVFGSGETTEVHYSGESWESGASGESGEIDERSVESSGFSGEENSGLSGDGSGFSGAEESGFSGIESSGLSDIDGSGLSGEEESGLSGDESGFSGEVDASGITDNSGDVIELTDLGSGASGEMPDMVIIDQGSGQKIIIVEGVDSTWCANVPDGFYALGCSSIVRACTFGVMETLECPDNMAFDPEKGVCDSPANVHLCTGQGIALDKPGESGDFSKRCIERGDGFFQKGCSASLIACSGGTETTLVCPSGLSFDEQKGFCVTRDSIPDCILEGSGDH